MHPDVVQTDAQRLEPYYRVTFGTSDQPLPAALLDALDIAIGQSDPPGCPDFQQWGPLGYPEAELSCLLRDHRAEYFPAPGRNAVIPAIGLTVPDDVFERSADSPAPRLPISIRACRRSSMRSTARDPGLLPATRLPRPRSTRRVTTSGSRIPMTGTTRPAASTSTSKARSTSPGTATRPRRS